MSPEKVVLGDVLPIIIDNLITNNFFNDSDHTKLFGFLPGNAKV